MKKVDEIQEFLKYFSDEEIINLKFTFTKPALPFIIHTDKGKSTDFTGKLQNKKRGLF